MRAVHVAAELRKLGAEIAPGAEGIVLRFPQGNRPPASLLDSARSIKPALAVLSLERPSAAMFADLGLGDELAGGLARLCARADPPRDITPERWREMKKTARIIAVEWAASALALGWSNLDLFGLHPAAPLNRVDGMGLAFLLTPADSIAALSADKAKIKRANGVEQTFQRETLSPESAPAWEI